MAIRWLTILWPAFVAAGALVFLVFAWVDPTDLHGTGGDPLALSRMAIYTIAFFAFWFVVALASYVAVTLSRDVDRAIEAERSVK